MTKLHLHHIVWAVGLLGGGTLTFCSLAPGSITQGDKRHTPANQRHRGDSGDSPTDRAPRPFYYGPLRRGESPVLITAGLVMKDKGDDSVSGEGYLWLFKRSQYGRWVLGWAQQEAGWAAGFEGILAFNAQGDATKQICVHGGGGDNQRMYIYGFRGKDYQPKELYQRTGKMDAEVVQEHGRFVVVEHWFIVYLIQAEGVKLPLPPKLRDHVLARRTFIYSAKHDRYLPVGGVEPDVAGERHLTPQEFREYRKELEEEIQYLKQTK